MNNIILKLSAAATLALAIACGGGKKNPDKNPDPVPVAVTGVTVTPPTLTLTAGGAPGRITATVEPYNASNKRVTWIIGSVNPPGCAELIFADLTATVTGKAAGTATITVATQDGRKTATCDVTVAPPVSIQGVTVTPGTLSLAVGGPTGSLTAAVAPSNADQAVTWTASPGGIVNIGGSSSTVTIAPVAAGITMVTATSVVDTTKRATCSVTVTATNVPVTGVTLPSTLSLAANGAASLTATIAPVNATNKNVTWTSSDPTKATVPSGNQPATINVTGVAQGSTTITARTADGNFAANCTVTVTAPVAQSVYIGGRFGMIKDGAAQTAYNGQKLNAIVVDDSNVVHACGFDPAPVQMPTYWKNGVKTTLPLSDGMVGGEALGMCLDGGTAHIAGYEGGSSGYRAKYWVVTSAGAVTSPTLPDFGTISPLDLGTFAFDICRLGGNTFICGGVDSANYYSYFYEDGRFAFLVWDLTPGSTDQFRRLSTDEYNLDEAYSITGSGDTLYVGGFSGLFSLPVVPGTSEPRALIPLYSGQAHSVKYSGTTLYACGYLDDHSACYWSKTGNEATTATILPTASDAAWSEARDIFVTPNGTIYNCGYDHYGNGNAPKLWIGTTVQNIPGWSGDRTKSDALTVFVK